MRPKQAQTEKTVRSAAFQGTGTTLQIQKTVLYCYFISTTKYIKKIKIKNPNGREETYLLVHRKRALVLVQDRHFDSLDFSYVGGFLDDAAGGSRGGAVLGLGQVGEGHGCVDLSPVRLVFTASFLLRHDAVVHTKTQIYRLHTCLTFAISV